MASVEIKLNLNDQIVLQALAGLLDGEARRVSLRKLTEVTGLTAPTIGKALGRLKKQGLLEETKTSAIGIASMWELTLIGAETSTRMTPTMGPLADCFRVRDYSGPGWLWTWAPKNIPMRFSDIQSLIPGPVRTTVHEYLGRLADLPAPGVSITEDRQGRQLNSYTFLPLDEEELTINLDHLSGRLKAWRPRTLAERQDESDRDRLNYRERHGEARYVDLVPMILEHSRQIPFPEHTPGAGVPPAVPLNAGCIEGPSMWMDEGGYIRVPGVQSNVVRAHRIMFYAHHGAIGDGQEIHHTCSNPRCVNVRHLAEVSRKEHRDITRSDGPWMAAVRSGKPIKLPVHIPPLRPVTLGHGSGMGDNAHDTTTT